MSSVAQLPFTTDRLSDPASLDAFPHGESDLTTRLLTVASEFELRVQELEHDRRRLEAALETEHVRDRVTQRWLKQIRRAHRQWSHAMTARTIRQACAVLLPAASENRHVRRDGSSVTTTLPVVSPSEQ